MKVDIEQDVCSTLEEQPLVSTIRIEVKLQMNLKIIHFLYKKEIVTQLEQEILQLKEENRLLLNSITALEMKQQTTKENSEWQSLLQKRKSIAKEEWSREEKIAWLAGRSHKKRGKSTRSEYRWLKDWKIATSLLGEISLEEMIEIWIRRNLSKVISMLPKKEGKLFIDEDKGMGREKHVTFYYY